VKRFKTKKQLIFIALIFLTFILTVGIYATYSRDSNPFEESVRDDIPISAPLSYAQDEVVKEEAKIAPQVAGASTSTVTQVERPEKIAPKTNNPTVQLPTGTNLPSLPAPTPNPDPQPTPTEITQEDKCSKPENNWVEFQIGSSYTQDFGGNGKEYTYEEGTDTKLAGFLSYSCIDRSEIVEMWYNATVGQPQCYCGEIYIPNVTPGTYQMIYLINVRNVVYYDYLTLIINAKPKPPVNNRPNAVISTPHGYFETKTVTDNSYTFNLYGEMQDVEDGVVTSGSSLKWYRIDNDTNQLIYLFDGSGSYTATIPNCTKVEVTIVLRVWDSGGQMDDEAYTVYLKNDNCI